jgi:hypothetical protein
MYILPNKRCQSSSDLLTASTLKHPLIIRSFHRTLDLVARNGRVDELDVMLKCLVEIQHDASEQQSVSSLATSDEITFV